MSSSKVSMIIRNMSKSPVFLKKGMQVAQVVSASLLLLSELSPEMEAALGMEDRHPSLLVAEWQGKLLEKLNLDELSNWTPWNTTVVWELVLTFHDVFALGYVGCRCNLPQPISLVQCHGTGEEEGWYAVLLCGFL